MAITVEISTLNMGCDITITNMAVDMSFNDTVGFSSIIDCGLSNTIGRTSIDAGFSDSTKFYLDCGSSTKYA